MGGEQDFLKKGYQKILKSMRHEVEKRPHWPEACIQADVSAATILERRMEEEKARQCMNFRKVGNILVA